MNEDMQRIRRGRSRTTDEERFGSALVSPSPFMSGLRSIPNSRDRSVEVSGSELIDLTESPPTNTRSIMPEVIDLDTVPDNVPVQHERSVRRRLNPPFRRSVADVLSQFNRALPRPQASSFPRRNLIDPSSSTTMFLPMGLPRSWNSAPQDRPGWSSPGRNIDYLNPDELHALFPGFDWLPEHPYPDNRASGRPTSNGAPPPVPPASKYVAPDPCKKPFTRTFTTSDVLICLGCKSELGGEGDEQKRKIFISKCSHVYCGDCGGTVKNASKSKGILCTAEGCGQKITKSKIWEAFI